MEKAFRNPLFLTGLPMAVSGVGRYSAALRVVWQFALIELPAEMVETACSHQGMPQERVMSHNQDAPIVHEYRGHQLFVKFDWDKPNDASPVAAHILESGAVDGLANTIADLSGPWADYHSALEEAMAAAERWIDSQLP